MRFVHESNEVKSSVLHQLLGADIGKPDITSQIETESDKNKEMRLLGSYSNGNSHLPQNSTNCSMMTSV